MALDTVYTSSTYNSFFTEVEIEEYIQQVKFSHGGEANWQALSPEDKESVILASVNYVNGEDWLGSQNADIVVSYMDWPRDPYGDATPDDIGLTSACWILNTLNGNDQGGSVAIGAIKKKVVGGVTIEYETGSTLPAADSSQTCAEQYASDYLNIVVLSGGIGSVGLGKYP